MMFQAGNFDLLNIAANIIFGAIGFAAFLYGKKNAFWRSMVIGIILMGYPYFFSNTLMVCLIGVVLVAVLFLWKE